MSEESWIEIWSFQLFFVPLHHNKTIKNMAKELKTIEIETLIAMFVIAMGAQIGSGFTYFIKLPTCFEQVKFKDSIVKLCAMRVDSECNLEFCFIDCFTDETFSLSLEHIRKNYPLMFASVVTHVCDTIENVDEI